MQQLLKDSGPQEIMKSENMEYIKLLILGDKKVKYAMQIEKNISLKLNHKFHLVAEMIIFCGVQV